MKILVLGRGVIGSQYGWALEQAGNTVDFYVRKSSRHDYKDYLELHTYDGRQKKMIEENWNINLRYEIPEDEGYDLILISVNPEQVAGAIESVSPIAKEATILLMGNYGGDPLKKIDLPIKEQCIVGFPGAGGGIDDNVLHGIMYSSFELGIKGDKPSAREEKVRKLFEDAGFKVKLQKNIDAWLVNHYVLNAAMEAEVMKRGSFAAVVESQDGLKNMLLNARRMVPYVKAKNIKPGIALRMMTLVPAGLMAKIMKKTLYKEHSPAYDAVAYNKYEAGYAVREIRAEAERLGVRI